VERGEGKKNEKTSLGRGGLSRGRVDLERDTHHMERKENAVDDTRELGTRKKGGRKKGCSLLIGGVEVLRLY